MQKVPFKCHGGKAYLAKRIAELLPPGGKYREPFLGGGAVLLAVKDRYASCVASDIDANTILIWQNIKTRPGEYSKELIKVLYTKQNFAKALDKQFPPHVNEYVLRRMSRGGLKRDFAWSYRTRGGIPGDHNAWLNAVRSLPSIDLGNVQFLVSDWSAAMREEDAVYYLDPPYLHSTRTVTKAYEYEMDSDVHEALLKRITSMNCPVVISGYDSELYNSYLGNWKKHLFEMPNHSGQGETKQRRVEVVWYNEK